LIAAGISILSCYPLDEKPKTASFYAPSVRTAFLFDDRDPSTPDQGAPPRSRVAHGALVGRFGLFVKDLSGTARDHGRALREAYELRLLADYDAGASGFAERATASLAAAASFIRFAQSLIKRR
jgi:hypothetical protein